MKSAFALLPALFAVAAYGKDAPIAAGVVELHGEHVVLGEASQSADGRYAAGWTVHPKKGQPPVKWGDFDKEGGSFREDYLFGDDYVVTNVIVDLPRRAVAVKLPFSDPYFSGKNHGALEVVFGPEKDGHRFAVALSDGKWNPYDVALVDLAGDGGSAVDLLKTLEAGIGKYIGSQSEGKKRLDPGNYSTDYQLEQLPETGLLTGFADAETVRIPFDSEVPKAENTRAFFGTIQLRLSRGKGGPHAEVVEVKEGKTDVPDPTQDDPRVAAADKELNAAYAAARGAANAAGKAKLLEEQRAWIKDRDEQVGVLKAKMAEEVSVVNPRFEADRLLLKLTQERAAALRGR